MTKQDWEKGALDLWGKSTHGEVSLVSLVQAACIKCEAKRYLEIGTHRGRTLCAAAQVRPNIHLYSFDLWIPNYGGAETSSPDFVIEELAKVKFKGLVKFVSGDSHVTLPKFLAEYPFIEFDAVLVDGDHSYEGAIADLEDVASRVRPGGVLIFDDIYHPQHPFLSKVWLCFLIMHPEYSEHAEFECGRGVGLAVKSTAPLG